MSASFLALRTQQLHQFFSDQHRTHGQSLHSSALDPKQLDFGKLSQRILTEVAQVKRLNPDSALLIRIGSETLEIPARNLDQATLIGVDPEKPPALASEWLAACGSESAAESL